MDFNVRNNKFDTCTFKNPIRNGRVTTAAKIAMALDKCNFLKSSDLLDIQLSNGYKEYTDETLPESIVTGTWGGGIRGAMKKAGIMTYSEDYGVYVKGRNFDNYITFLKDSGVTSWK